ARGCILESIGQDRFCTNPNESPLPSKVCLVVTFTFTMVLPFGLLVFLGAIYIVDKLFPDAGETKEQSA
ncbi:hypothetical protein PENTCL1PPCAC_20195, partial [Pristionchus entomophagus]